MAEEEKVVESEEWSASDTSPSMESTEETETETEEKAQETEVQDTDVVETQDVIIQGKTVPLEALRDERVKRQALENRMQELTDRFNRVIENLVPKKEEKSPEDEFKIPDFDVDPLGNLRSSIQVLAKQLSDLTTHNIKQVETGKVEKTQNQLTQRWNTDINLFARENPDFHDAIKFLAKNRTDELKELGYSDKEIPFIIGREAQDLAERSYQEMAETGKLYNPVSKLYNIAKKRGFKGNAKENEREIEDQKGNAQRDERKGNKNPKVLRDFKGSGKPAQTKYTAEYIANLSEDEFEQLMGETDWKTLHS